MEPLTLKDFLPLIGTTATILAGYFFLSAQANKNRRVRWIDDFVKEVANFSALATSLSVNNQRDIDKTLEIMRSVNVLKLYIYPFKNPPQPHRAFTAKLIEVQTILMSTDESKQSDEVIANTMLFGKKLAETMSLATEVIRIEQGKI